MARNLTDQGCGRAQTEKDIYHQRDPVNAWALHPRAANWVKAVRRDDA